MIKYKLICECSETFESWFSSSKEYEYLKKKKFINCIYCNSAMIKKSIMSPNITTKSSKKNKNNKLEKNLKKKLIDFRTYIEKNCKDVGDNFPQEARSIHYDKKTSKGIYGKATAEETAELHDEGIEIQTVPWINKFEN